MDGFYLRLDNHDFTAQMKEMREKTTAPPAFDSDVKRATNVFGHAKTKSSGLDNICGQVKTSADQLCILLFQNTLTQFLKLLKVLKLWKHSIIVPVATSKTP